MNNHIESDIIDQNRGLEGKNRELIEKSETRAWHVAKVSWVISLILGAVIVSILPLREVIPFLVRDNGSGIPEVITRLDAETLTTDEAMDKHFISQYVKTREGYYFNTIVHDYELIQKMSSEDVAFDYRQVYEGKNARDQILGNTNDVTPEIISIVLSSSRGPQGEEIKLATVRVRLIQRNLSTHEEITKNIVVSLTYEYLPTKNIVEGFRMENPLGFIVTHYRVDNEA
ncbi:virB8 family protein [Aggregatibacter actinomycetemcomitans]|uniref:virB8 family protein n=1 Tax=Aggregatibacter actinomycetemcomitans TaxID=714 RepID=UPI00197CADFB|nr:type IV secretion system protein [Aggregatibacter actinomycetemcomitans]MBN6059384.1 type IV secretion system protein [Aggregatibacter actinomycetemcomitans]MBN6087885.1 type IV secretion system protein [Aggregatibacter actinomycetemcomitans]